MWSVSSLLHADLLCALVRLNSRGTLDMYHMSKLITSSGNRQPHMARHTNKLVTSAPFTINTCGTPDMHPAHHERKQFVGITFAQIDYSSHTA